MAVGRGVVDEPTSPHEIQATLGFWKVLCCTTVRQVSLQHVFVPAVRLKVFAPQVDSASDLASVHYKAISWQCRTACCAASLRIRSHEVRRGFTRAQGDDAYKAAVERSKKRASEESREPPEQADLGVLSRAKALSKRAEEGHFFDMSSEQQQLAEDYDSGRVTRSLRKLVAQRAPVYRGVGASVPSS